MRKQFWEHEPDVAANREEERADRLQAKVEALQAEIKRLRDIVDKLPKTADGVPVVPGMTVWVNDNGIGVYAERHVEEVANTGFYKYVERRAGWSCEWCAGKNSYSTREAAEAGGKKEQQKEHLQQDRGDRG